MINPQLTIMFLRPTSVPPHDILEIRVDLPHEILRLCLHGPVCSSNGEFFRVGQLGEKNFT